MIAARTDAKRTMTIEEFAQIDEPGRFDLVDGEVWALPAASIPHGRFAVRIILALGDYVRQHPTGEVFAGELGYVISRTGRTVLCPDVSFVRTERLPGDEETGFFPGVPDLAVEVISPPESRKQVATKVDRYLRAGTPIVWCVYPEERWVVVHAPDTPPRTLGPADTLDGGSLLPELRLPLAEFFG
jgi:Uma2 family endonuclease